MAEGKSIRKTSSTQHRAKAFGYSMYIDRPTKRDLERIIKYYTPLLTTQIRKYNGEDSETTLR